MTENHHIELKERITNYSKSALEDSSIFNSASKESSNKIPIFSVTILKAVCKQAKNEEK
jgi:hypothetical protein